MAAKDFGNPTKAKDADLLILTASRFDQLPDLWVTNGDFRELKRMSNGTRSVQVQLGHRRVEVLRTQMASVEAYF
jgi:hypothetical protein